MKQTPSSYAKAFCTIATQHAGSEERIVDEFLNIVRANGDWGKRARIVAECERAYRAMIKRPFAVVESARPLSTAQKNTVKGALHISSDADIQERLVPELVAGVRITVDGQRQLDCTLSHVLNKTFETI